MAERAIAKLGGVRQLVLRGPRPNGDPRVETPPAAKGIARPSSLPVSPDPPSYDIGRKVATRKAYGDALVPSARGTIGSSPWMVR